MNKEQIIKDYLSGLSAKKVAIKHNIHESTVFKYLKESNIKSRSNKVNNKKFICDEYYFQNVDTQEKAYWLGFIYADGYQTKNNYFGLSLSVLDKSHLEKFNLAIRSTYSIKEYRVVSGYKPGAPYCRLTFKSELFCKFLTEHGAMQNKTLILKFPETIPENLYSHFIRGYFDGDGSWTKDSKTKIGRQFKLCGTEDFLNSICDILNIPKKLYKKANSFYISKAGEKVLDIMNFLYSDSEIHLDRKYIIYQQIIQSRQQVIAE